MSITRRKFGMWILLGGSYLSVSIATAGPGEGNPQVNPQLRLAPAFELLGRSPSGKLILESARKMKIPINEGHVSKTEMTATRTTQGNKESMKYSTQVLIARDKDPVFQALDLAHELTHATHPNTNPFDPNLNAEDYVKHGIEGVGGEAQAILQECRVGKELLGQLEEDTGQLIKARCQFVWKTENDEDKWKNSFYHLGQHYHDFIKMVGRIEMEPAKKIAWAKSVESRSPMFASAVTHKPYPLALLEEYVQVTQKICEKIMSGNRKIASASNVITSLSNRCQSVQNIP